MSQSSPDSFSFQPFSCYDKLRSDAKRHANGSDCRPLKHARAEKSRRHSEAQTMNYDESIRYFQNIPPFIPRKTAPGEELFNLDNIKMLTERLGHPEKKLRFIHVAGTNGKGSTCAFLRTILTAAHYRTGLFTSPELEDFREQITVDGEMIPKEDLAELMTYVRAASEELQRQGLGKPSAFEQLTALAFLYFVKKDCQLAVLETGLGGRLDATNVIPAPLISVITSISLEHTEMLGNTIEKIAREKAGIIKTGSSAVLLYPQKPEALRVFEDAAADKNVPLHIAAVPMENEPLHEITHSLDGQTFTLPDFDGFCFGEPISIRLLGPYQVNNAAAAADTAVLLGKCGFPVSGSAIRRGLLQTVWPGRFELLRRNPCFIVDASHNPEGAASLSDGLRCLFPDRKIVFICGVLADKDFDAMFSSVMPLAKHFFTVTPNSPRALPAEALAAHLQSKGCCAESCTDIADAYEKALEILPENGVLCAFGSFYFVGILRKLAVRGRRSSLKHPCPDQT